ncbi:MAG: hypothetical protein ACLFR1_16150 [Spirochaetia bacterium]
MKLIVRPIFFLLVIFLTACSENIEQGDVNSIVTHLEQRVPDMLSEYNVPGASMALIYNF